MTVPHTFSDMVSVLGQNVSKFLDDNFNAVSNLQYSPISAGAKGDGVTDDTLAFQAGHDFLESLPNGGTYYLPNNSVFRLDGGFTWNPGKVRIELNGSKLDFSNVTAVRGYWILFRQTITDPNQRAAANRAHPMSNGWLVGNGVANVTAFGIFDNAAFNLPCVTRYNVTVSDAWRVDEYANGAFLANTHSCVYIVTKAGNYDCAVLQNVNTGGGENNHYFGGQINQYPTGVRNVASDAVLFLSGISIDYCHRAIDAQAGNIIGYGYIESNTDDDYWVYCTGIDTGAQLRFRFTITANKFLHEIFYCDSGTQSAGIDFRGSSFYWGANTYSGLNLVSSLSTSGGRVIGDISSQSHLSVHPAVGGSYSDLNNGGFEFSNLTDWTLSGTVFPAIVTGPSHSGTRSLLFSPSTTNAPKAVLLRPCQPGQQSCGLFWWESSGLTASGSIFSCTLEYLDAGGSTLAFNSLLSTSSNQATFAGQPIYIFNVAPPGTVNYRMTLACSAATSGSASVWVDDVTCKAI